MEKVPECPGLHNLCHSETGCSSVLSKARLPVLLMKDHSILYATDRSLLICHFQQAAEVNADKVSRPRTNWP